jgi:hypothetical protein
MVIVDQLLQITDAHRAATHIVDSTPLIGVAVHHIQITSVDSTLGSLGFGLAQSLHVLNVFLLEQQVVVDSLHSEVS